MKKNTQDRINEISEEEAEAREWTEACQALEELEGRWEDNGCHPEQY